MLLPLPSQETAEFTDVAQRLRHNFGKDRCRPTDASPNLPTELASQPSSSSNGMQTGFYQSPRGEATALTGKNRYLSYPWNEAFFQRLDASLFPASPPSAKTTPHHTAEASCLVKEFKVYQRIAEVYQPPMKKQSFQIQLSRRRWATIHNFFAVPIRVTQCLLRSTPAFDKDELSPLPSSIT